MRPFVVIIVKQLGLLANWPRVQTGVRCSDFASLLFPELLTLCRSHGRPHIGAHGVS